MEVLSELGHECHSWVGKEVGRPLAAASSSPRRSEQGGNLCGYQPMSPQLFVQHQISTDTRVTCASNMFSLQSYSKAFQSFIFESLGLKLKLSLQLE